MNSENQKAIEKIRKGIKHLEQETSCTIHCGKSHAHYAYEYFKEALAELDKPKRSLLDRKSAGDGGDITERLTEQPEVIKTPKEKTIEKIASYCEHRKNCATWTIKAIMDECDCGLDQALAGLQKQSEVGELAHKRIRDLVKRIISTDDSVIRSLHDTIKQKADRINQLKDKNEKLLALLLDEMGFDKYSKAVVLINDDQALEKQKE